MAPQGPLQQAVHGPPSYSKSVGARYPVATVTERPRPAGGPSGLLFSSALLAALVAAGLFFDRSAEREATASKASVSLDRELARAGWSPEVRQIASWSITSDDHGGQPFVIIDQARARLFAFTGQGLLAGSTRVLRDDSHHAPLPAGRYSADAWRSARAGTVVWADAERDLSLQAMPAVPSPELFASTVAANEPVDASVRVAGDFYRQHLRAFRSQDSVLYVLPDVMPLQRNLTRYAAWSCQHPDRIDQPRTLS